MPNTSLDDRLSELRKLRTVLDHAENLDDVKLIIALLIDDLIKEAERTHD